MPQAIEFEKDRARYLLDCLANGSAIEPRQPGEWRRLDQLVLAGAALFGALSHGPTFVQPDLTPEQRAEADGMFTEETLGTIAFLAQVAMAVLDDEYDERWEPIMRAVVSGFPPRVQPVEGWRR